jgi:putative oxidoreductase
MNSQITDLTKNILKKWNCLLGELQHLFLLAIRLYWGWQFMLTGRGKFLNFDRTVGFFTSLGIPFPEINVFMASATEFLGGICLMLGLGSRFVNLPLIITMCVAYLSAHTEELNSLFSDPDKFFQAPPFSYLCMPH